MIPTAAAPPKYNKIDTCKNQEQKKLEVILQQVPLALEEKNMNIDTQATFANFKLTCLASMSIPIST